MGRSDFSLHPLFPVIPFVLFFLAGCSGTPKQPIIRPVEPPPPPAAEVQHIIDYQGKEEGETVPRWIELYLAGRRSDIEASPEFYNKYVFVASNEGSRFEILSLWAREFSGRRDVPRLVASRTEDRMTGKTLYPDDEYGEFFERFIKDIFNSVFEASVDSVYWIRQRSYEEDGVTVDQERYRFFILITIDKPVLERELFRIMNMVKTIVPPTRDQAAAINHLKENFFTGF
ncbi:MAG: hypothetical protein LBD71_04730 [Treponema sp.]|nr:hypothetical protein [Treponema sp.]